MATRPIPLFQVDAFTTRPFEGNPAAICLLDGDDVSNQGDHGDHGNLPDSLMKSIAAEMNLSETAFVKRINSPPTSAEQKPGYHYSLRWFTPMVEVSLCGHATLATAHVIFSRLPADVKQLTFHTLSGELIAEKDDAGEGFYSIFLPTAQTIPFSEAKLDFPNLDLVLKAVIGETEIQEILYVPSRKRILVRLSDKCGREGIEAFTPNLSAMTSLHDGSLCSSVTVTTKGKGEYDFFSRHFSPWIGIPEDPVTGSAHSYIATYWATVLQKQQFYARQCSKRGGDLRITLLENERMRIEGKCADVFEGKLFLPVS